MADVAALIPTLGNDLARVQRAVDAVLASQTSLSIEVIVVVNAKTDPFLSAGVALPTTATVVVTGANLGWAGGLHAGRSASTAGLIWLVQDDMEPDPLCLDRLATALQSPHAVALVAPVVVNDVVRDAHGVIVGGTVARHSLGGTLNPEVFATEVSPSDDLPIIINRFPTHDTPFAELTAVPVRDFIPSRGMLMAASTWDSVGGMDARFYPVGATDVDFCQALRAAQLEFRIAVGANATHLRSGSTPKSLARVVFKRNRRRVVEKWRDSSGRDVVVAAEVSPATRDAVLIGATEAVSALSEELDRVSAERDALTERIRALRG